MKITPITAIYRPKFNIKKGPIQVDKMLDPVRVDFVERAEPVPSIVYKNDDKEIYIDMVKMVVVIFGIFLILMELLKRGYL